MDMVVPFPFCWGRWVARVGAMYYLGCDWCRGVGFGWVVGCLCLFYALATVLALQGTGGWSRPGVGNT